MNLLTDAGRYLMILLMAIYTYLSFRYFGVGEEKDLQQAEPADVFDSCPFLCNHLLQDWGRAYDSVLWGTGVFSFSVPCFVSFFLPERVQSSDE